MKEVDEISFCEWVETRLKKQDCIFYRFE